MACITPGCKKPSYNGGPGVTCCRECTPSSIGGAPCITAGCRKPTYNGKPGERCCKECTPASIGGAICTTPGCGKNTFNGKPGQRCCRECPRCITPGCTKRTFDGNPGRTCCRECGPASVGGTSKLAAVGAMTLHSNASQARCITPGCKKRTFDGKPGGTCCRECGPASVGGTKCSTPPCIKPSFNGKPGERCCRECTPTCIGGNICITDGCRKITFNGKPGEKCCRECTPASIGGSATSGAHSFSGGSFCITPGCGKPTWDGKPGGKCKKSCGNPFLRANAHQSPVVGLLQSHGHPGPAVRLVKLAWLDAQMKKGSGWRLERRQLLDDAAFTTPDDAVAAFKQQTDGVYEILALSYAWLTKDHPDPRSFYQKQWLLLYEQYLSLLAASGLSKVRLVFWDYLSLFQESRTPDEAKLFKMALGVMHHMYACESIAVARLTTVPDCRRITKYEDRGWPMLESRVAFSKSQSVISGTKGSGHVVFTICEVDPNVCEIHKHMYVPPLIHPDDFDKQIEKKVFAASGVDLARVKKLYKDFWDEGGLARTESLQYGCGFTDDDIDQLVRLVGQLPRLKCIDLRPTSGIHFYTELAKKRLEAVCKPRNIEVKTDW